MLNHFLILNLEFLYIYLPFYQKDINDFRNIEENERIKNEKNKENGENISDIINLNEDYLYDVIN